MTSTRQPRIHVAQIAVIGILFLTGFSTLTEAQTARDNTTFVRVDDMLLPQAPGGGSLASTASVTGSSFTPWPGGLIPVEFASSITDANRQAVFSACSIWSKRAAVSCVARTNQTPYLRVTADSGGCYANVGSYAGRDAARMNLDINGCWGQKSVLHELGHVLGLQHEHQRPDRDSYISIDTSAVDPAYQSAFTLLTGAPTRGAYDFLSVMHYHDFAFAARPLTRTMLPKPGFEWLTYSLGSSDFPSNGDGDAVQAIYGGGATYWPARVQNLRIAQGVAGTGVHIAWDLPTGAPEVTQYSGTVYVGQEYLQSSVLQSFTAAPTATGVTLNLQPGHYFLTVKGDSADGEYARSTVFSFTVSSATGASSDLSPGAPALAAAGAGGDRVTLSWQGGAGPSPTLYTVYAGTTPGSNNLGSYPVGTATSITTSAPVGVTAYLRVVASNNVGAATSNEVSFYVPSEPSPSGLALSVQSSANPVVLSWSPANDAAANYTIVAGTAPGGADVGVYPMGQLREVAANAPVGIPLYVRIVAATSRGLVASNEVAFQMPAPWAADAPTMMQPMVSGDNVTLTWGDSNASSYTIVARNYMGGPVIAAIPAGRLQNITIPNVPAGIYVVTIASTPGFAESNAVLVTVG
jgi:hypothetical protein